MRIRESLVDADQTPSGSGDDLGGIAVFFDLENIVLGIQDEFTVKKVIDALNERGDVMIRRAYADWGRYRRHQRQFLEEGVQMVFLPSYGVSDKNRTDTAICVDAMEILFTRHHIETFVICSGDSDFGILAQRLRDHGKRVVGLSAKSAASQILVKQCHEFIFYETLVGQRVQGYSVEEGEVRLKRALEHVVDDYGSTFKASLLKDRMRKQDPTFNERNYGASSFTRFLRNYEHLVQVLEGGMVRIGRGAPQHMDEEPSEAASSRGRGGPDRPKAPPPKLLPEVEAEARDALSRAILAAAEDDEPVRLSRLKDTLQEVAPDFDELGLGYRTFTSFLKAFPDIVWVDRVRNVARPADELLAAMRGEAAEAPRAARAAEPAPAAEVEAPRPPARVEERYEERYDERYEDEGEGEGGGRKLTREERRRIRAAARPSAPKPVASEAEATIAPEPQAEAKAEAKPAPKPEATKPEAAKAAARPEPKPEAKPEPKLEAKPEPKPQAKPTKAATQAQPEPATAEVESAAPSEAEAAKPDTKTARATRGRGRKAPAAKKAEAEAEAEAKPATKATRSRSKKAEAAAEASADETPATGRKPSSRSRKSAKASESDEK